MVPRSIAGIERLLEKISEFIELMSTARKVDANGKDIGPVISSEKNNEFAKIQTIITELKEPCATVKSQLDSFNLKHLPLDEGSDAHDVRHGMDSYVDNMLKLFEDLEKNMSVIRNNHESELRKNDAGRKILSGFNQLHEGLEGLIDVIQKRRLSSFIDAPLKPAASVKGVFGHLTRPKELLKEVKGVKEAAIAPNQEAEPTKPKR